MRITSLAIGNASLDDEEMVEELITSGQLVDTHDYAEEVLNTMGTDKLDEVLNTLTPSERAVLRLRFGLDDGKARTLEEVGKEFDVTRERVRQIEAKAIRKLRHPLRSKSLKDYLDSEVERYGR